jgi:hypothetical protein
MDIAVGVGAYGTNEPRHRVTNVVIIRHEGRAIDKQASAGLPVGIADGAPLDRVAGQ